MPSNGAAELFMPPDLSRLVVPRLRAVSALRIVSLGYVFYGVGMVMINAFNGAGDSKTPTWINLFWFWVFQIPLAYLLAIVLHIGSTGVFIAIVTTETCITITSVILFKRGKWKLIKI